MSNKNYFCVGFVTLLLAFVLICLILWKNSVFTKIKSYKLIGEFSSINGLLTNSTVSIVDIQLDGY